MISSLKDTSQPFNIRVTLLDLFHLGNGNNSSLLEFKPSSTMNLLSLPVKPPLVASTQGLQNALLTGMAFSVTLLLFKGLVLTKVVKQWVHDHISHYPEADDLMQRWSSLLKVQLQFQIGERIRYMCCING